MDYLEQDQEYFKPFVDNCGHSVASYIDWKRRDAVWGDNIEIQLMSEIY